MHALARGILRQREMSLEMQHDLDDSRLYRQSPPKGVREWIFVTVLCSTQLLGQNEANRLTWHVSGYSMTVGTFILVAGKLGDLHGSKRIFVLGWAWSGVWTIIGGCSAFTHSPISFDIVRSLQGIGPAFLLPNVLAIAGRTYPPGKIKNMVFSAFAMAAHLGCSTAGAVGAARAEWIRWPWVMWLYGVGCFVLALIALWVVPSDSHRSRQYTAKVTGLLSLSIAWNQAPIDGWSTPYVCVVLIVGFLVRGLFVLQKKRALDPVLDVSIFKRQSAAQFAPGAISGVIAALATPYLMSAMSSGWLMVIACGSFLVGCLLMSTAPVEQSYWINTSWSFVIMAGGMDISFPASATILSDAIPVKDQGASASLVNAVVNYSITIGLGIAGTVEAQVGHGGGYLLLGSVCVVDFCRVVVACVRYRFGKDISQDHVRLASQFYFLSS
ncbi:major facilitator superfamily domain-containing protein [Aspergillus undulatus]|uniref:major facilitator superfamily domain-containing protein n=1 Tax=Aspergillus undulatus TaxID=1810928 RepID=UPI003CCD06F9